MANWFKGCYPTYNLPVYYEELEGRDPGYTMGWIGQIKPQPKSNVLLYDDREKFCIANTESELPVHDNCISLTQEEAERYEKNLISELTTF